MVLRRRDDLDSLADFRAPLPDDGSSVLALALFSAAFFFSAAAADATFSATALASSLAFSAASAAAAFSSAARASAIARSFSSTSNRRFSARSCNHPSQSARGRALFVRWRRISGAVPQGKISSRGSHITAVFAMISSGQRGRFGGRLEWQAATAPFGHVEVRFQLQLCRLPCF